MLTIIFGITTTAMLISWAIDAARSSNEVLDDSDNDSGRTAALIAENERLLAECRRRRMGR